MKFNRWTWIPFAILSLGLAACGDDDDDGGFDGDYTLTMIATEFGPHNGQTVHVAVTEAGSMEVIARDEITVANDAFSFAWPLIMKAGHSYEIHYYADSNDNGQCDMPPIDHGWLVEVHLRDVSGDVTINVTHDVPNGIHGDDDDDDHAALEADDHEDQDDHEDDDHEHGFDQEVCDYF